MLGSIKFWWEKGGGGEEEKRDPVTQDANILQVWQPYSLHHLPCLHRLMIKIQYREDSSLVQTWKKWRLARPAVQEFFWKIVAALIKTNKRVNSDTPCYQVPRLGKF